MKAYEDLDHDPLQFTIRGKTYTIPPLGYRTGLKLTAILSGEDKSLANAKGEELYRLAMGPVWDEMAEDDCPADAMLRAALATIAEHQSGRPAAEKIWEEGWGEALAAATAALDASTTSPATAAAGSSTSTPASTSGTSSRPKKNARSAGTSSSTSGT